MHRFILRWGVVLALVFLTSAAFAQEEEIENLIANGGGEIDSKGIGIPDGWSARGCTIQRVKEPKTEGDFAVKITLSEEEYHTIGLPPVFSFGVGSGTVVRLLADIRFDKPEGSTAGCRIRWKADEKSNEFQTYNRNYYFASVYLNKKNIEPNAGFKTYEMVNKIAAKPGLHPPGLVCVKGKGTIYIDNVRMFIVKPDEKY